MTSYLTAYPVKKLNNVTIKIPGDKSMSHRALIVSSLAIGQSNIENLLFSEDVLATLNILRQLGVRIKVENNQVKVFGNGILGYKQPENILNAGNSGTTARLMMGLLAPFEFSFHMTGDESLIKRPMKRLTDLLKPFGANGYLREDNKLPFYFKGNKYPMPVICDYHHESAQIKSALILAGINTDGITIVNEYHKTRDHLERLLKYFGAHIEEKEFAEYKQIKIKGCQEFAAKDIFVPSDFSSAAFFIAAALLKEDSEITLKDIGVNEYRLGFLKAIEEMGAIIELKNKRLICNEEVADIYVKYTKLGPVNIKKEAASSLIDEYPILSILAASANGVSRFEGLSELRIKESDRLAAIENLLSILGVKFNSGHDYIEIFGENRKFAPNKVIDSKGDHRIAMTALTASLNSDKEVKVQDVQNISTSFPSFVECFNQLGGKVL